MSPIQRGELENIVNAQIAAIVVLSRHLKWIKSSLEMNVLVAIPSMAATVPAVTDAITRLVIGTIGNHQLLGYRL